MADRFRTFALTPANTGANTLFTVPVANVAATPPTPVTTFMVKTDYKSRKLRVNSGRA